MGADLYLTPVSSHSPLGVLCPRSSLMSMIRKRSHPGGAKKEKVAQPEVGKCAPSSPLVCWRLVRGREFAELLEQTVGNSHRELHIVFGDQVTHSWWSLWSELRTVTGHNLSGAGWTGGDPRGDLEKD